MRSTSDIKLAIQTVLAKYGYIMPKDLYLAIEDLHDEIESDRQNLSLDDCEEQLKDWARELVDAEIRRRPEGKKLKQLEDLKQRSIDTVMESGTPEELIRQLDATTKKIGIAWVIDTSKIKQITN